MRLRDKIILGLIIVLVAFAVVSLAWPPLGKALDREEFSFGLDLEGGAHLVYEADLEQAENKEEAMKGVITVLQKRINAYGVNEPVIQQMGSARILVQLPGIKEIEEAKSLIGQTTLITFKERKNDEEGDPITDEQGNYVYEWVPATAEINGEEKELTSKYFEGRVEVVLDPNTNAPQVAFQWNDEGAEIFDQITERLYKKPLGIFLGEEKISSPIIQERQFAGGRGVITGMSLDEAQRLTNLLNAGRIPVPLHTIEEHDVSPTLGANFIDWSVKAGIIGLGLIILFMILYYRLPGVMAGIALLMYAAFVLTAFKLIPVTLTLAGIAGFVLSIGMAVDANVLIFERMKEEIRMGRTMRRAIDVGFDRAWPAIRDSNISTFITCGILYWMGSTLAVPAVMGFALTLFVGVAISMFSAIMVTRTLLRILGSTQVIKKVSLFAQGGRQTTLSEGR
ncbi:MAG: protein translocase subunit SecD [Chloroflexota bacterium]